VTTAALSEPPIEAPLSAAVDVERVVFIAGVGRSGTSLLHSMLNAHPSLAFPPETHFFRRYVSATGRRRRLETAASAALCEQLRRDTDFARLAVAPELLLSAPGAGAPDTLAAFRALLRAVAERQGKTRVGEKDPRHIDDIAALAAAFPQALLVHVYRDPREVLLSRTKAEWSRGRPWWLHALLAQDQVRRARSLGPRHFGERYVEVRYEELLDAPEAVLRRITSAAGLAYAPEMLDFASSAQSLVDARERSWKGETLGPLLRDNKEKWRRGLTPFQIEFVEAVSATAFDELGYTRSRGPGALRVLSPLLRGPARAVFAVRRALERRRC